MRPTLYFQSPIETRSGYGARGRDFLRALIALDRFDISVLSTRWGDTPFIPVEDDLDRLIFRQPPTAPPEILIQHTVPQEFRAAAPISIGLTAGYEADRIHPGWINAINAMSATIVSSKFAKQGILASAYKLQNGQILSIENPERIHVVTEGLDVEKFKKPSGTNVSSRLLKHIPEPFLFLNVGMWLQGGFGEDRKDIGRSVRIFLDAFRGRKDVALVLKTQMITPSEHDREEVIARLEAIVGAQDSPKVYLIHGEMTDNEIVDLYHDKRIKAMYSLTHGEGFGRPFAEFALTGKPVIAPVFGGHMDFLSKTLSPIVKVELKPIPRSAYAEGMTPPGGQWGVAIEPSVHAVLNDVVERYDLWKAKSVQLRASIEEKFSFEAMKDQLKKVLDQVAPEDDLDIPTAREVTL